MIIHHFDYDTLEDDEIQEGIFDCKIHMAHHQKLMVSWEIELERLEKEQKRREEIK